MAFRGKNVTIARHDKSTWCECSWVLMDEIWKMCRIWTVAAVFSERRIFFFLHTAGSHSSLGGPKTKAECSTLRQGMAQRRVSKNIVGAGQNDAVGRQTLSNHCTRTPETILLLTVRGMFFKAFEYGHWPPRLNVDCHQFFCAKKKEKKKERRSVTVVFSMSEKKSLLHPRGIDCAAWSFSTFFTDIEKIDALLPVSLKRDAKC